MIVVIAAFRMIQIIRASQHFAQELFNIKKHAISGCERKRRD